ncbi:hypothetical protein J6590_010870 [Homalodisca vitripennis]|nr:hypothetical protein J6590_010870 [Homalodisca vitripennis]
MQSGYKFSVARLHSLLHGAMLFNHSECYKDVLSNLDNHLRSKTCVSKSPLMKVHYESRSLDIDLDLLVVPAISTRSATRRTRLRGSRENHHHYVTKQRT